MRAGDGGVAEGEAEDKAGGDEEVADVGVDQRPLGVLEPIVKG